jgi:DNA-binding transcriptional ArsR family regulator
MPSLGPVMNPSKDIDMSKTTSPIRPPLARWAVAARSRARMPPGLPPRVGDVHACPIGGRGSIRPRVYLSRCLIVGPRREAVDRVFHALADPNRRVIVERLSRGPASVSELARPLPMSLPTVVQHLHVLEASGLVRSEKIGRVRTCRVEPAALQPVEHGSAHGA